MINEPSIIAKISRIFLTWQRYNQKLIQPYGVTLKQFAVLEQLYHHPYRYPSDLADVLYADRPTITVIINNLAKAGLLEKHSDPDDKKRIRIEITALGRLKYTSYLESPENQNKLKITACLTADEKQQLHILLDKINHHLTQISPQSSKGGHNDE